MDNNNDDKSLALYEFPVKEADANPIRGDGTSLTDEEVMFNLHMAEADFIVQLHQAQDVAPMPVVLILMPWKLEEGMWRRRAAFIPEDHFFFTTTPPVQSTQQHAQEAYVVKAA